MKGRLSEKLRQQIISRDSEKCQKCGMSLAEHYEKYARSLTVDHIDGNGRGSDNPNDSPENLMTLCLKCHGEKDRARRKINSGWKRPDRKEAARDFLTGRFV